MYDCDRSAYRQCYFETITKSADLPADVLENISAPQAFACHHLYRSSTPKIMIMGQETLNNELSLSNLKPYDAWISMVGATVDFDFGMHSYPPSGGHSSRFWHAYDEICSAFCLSSPASSAWSNLIKVQRLSYKIGSVSIGKAPWRDAILNWQKALLVAEIDYFQPDAIIMLTGQWTWAACFLLDATREQIGEYDLRGVGRLRSAAISHVPIAYTYHPQARVITEEVKKELRRVAVEDLKSRLLI